MGNRKYSTTNFEDLQAWQVAMDLAVLIYNTTKIFPAEEKYALTNQLRRAASSISANLAEGYGRHGAKEKLQFYKVANGSLLEVKSFCYLAHKLEYITEKQLSEVLELVTSNQKLINALIKSIRNKNE